MSEVALRNPINKTAEISDNKVEVINPDKVSSITTDSPVSLYEHIEGIPYTAKYFNMQNIMKSDSSLVEDIRNIEKTYRYKVSKGELKDSEVTYKDFIKEAEKATDTKNAPDDIKLRKIAKWLSFMREMDQLDEIKQWL